MPDYDSDSDFSESELTDTNVLLGYAQAEPVEGDDDTSFLGGEPNWMDDCPPSADLVTCQACQGMMPLLMQLNAELPDRFPGHLRRLYLFACPKPACRRKPGSLRGLRAVAHRTAVDSKTDDGPTKDRRTTESPAKKTEPADKPAPTTGLGEALFGSGSGSTSANPFQLGKGSSALANPFAPKTSSIETAKSDDKAQTEESKQKESEGKESEEKEPKKESETTPEPQPKESETRSETERLGQTMAEKLSIHATPSPQPVSRPLPPRSEWPRPYRKLYLDAEREYLEPESTHLPPNARIDTSESGLLADDDQTSSGGKGGGGKEDDPRGNFESSMDATFQKFADRMDQNPDQVLRYEFAGKPLLYTKDDPVGKKLSSWAAASTTTDYMPVAVCGNCRQPRVFEVQLVPRTISELEGDEVSLEGMDWGTILVGVCRADCQATGVVEGAVGYLEEWVGVQWE